MLKFFRTIRRELIDDNQAKKYLLYAIGEIILVVFGILIALQINNWNIAETEKQTVRKYFSQLSEEFEALAGHERTRLEKSEQIIENIKSCQRLMNERNPKKIPEFKECLPYLATAWEDRPQYPIFQEFLNEGWMSKIDDQETKRLLINLRETLLLIEEMDGIINKKFEEQVIPFFNKNINSSEISSIASYVTNAQGGPASDFTGLLNNFELWNLFNEKHNLTAFVASIQGKAIALLEEVSTRLRND